MDVVTGINVADFSAKESKYGRVDKIHCSTVSTPTLKELHNGENVDKFIVSEACTKLQNTKDFSLEIPDSLNEENHFVMGTEPCSSSSPRNDNAFILGSKICESKIDYDTIALNDTKEINADDKLSTRHQNQRIEDVKSIIPDSFDDVDEGNEEMKDTSSTVSPIKDDVNLLRSAICQNVIGNNNSLSEESISENKILNLAYEVAEHKGLLPNVSDIMEQVSEKHFFCFNNDSAREPIADRNEDFLFKSVVSICRKNLNCISCREGLTDCCTSDDANGDKFQSNLELKGRYMHQYPVLSVFFISVGSGLQICVISGLMECNDRHVFIYKVSFNNQNTVPPLFLGYTSISYPVIQNPFYGNVSGAFSYFFTSELKRHSL